jgi:hypothetical protein
MQGYCFVPAHLIEGVDRETGWTSQHTHDVTSHQPPRCVGCVDLADLVVWRSAVPPLCARSPAPCISRPNCFVETPKSRKTENAEATPKLRQSQVSRSLLVSSLHLTGQSKILVPRGTSSYSGTSSPIACTTPHHTTLMITTREGHCTSEAHSFISHVPHFHSHSNLHPRVRLAPPPCTSSHKHIATL